MQTTTGKCTPRSRKYGEHRKQNIYKGRMSRVRRRLSLSGKGILVSILSMILASVIAASVMYIITQRPCVYATWEPPEALGPSNNVSVLLHLINTGSTDVWVEASITIETFSRALHGRLFVYIFTGVKYRFVLFREMKEYTTFRVDLVWPNEISNPLFDSSFLILSFSLIAYGDVNILTPSDFRYERGQNGTYVLKA